MLALITLLSLSYILQEAEFGKFALISTNALFVQILFGSWITSSANKFISLEYDKNREISLILSLVIITFFAVFLTIIFYTLFFKIEYKISFSIFYFSCSIILFDIILAILNGTGSADQYAQLSLIRAFGAFVCPVLVAAIGGNGLQVAIASATAVVFSMLMCYPARSILAHAILPTGLLSGMKRYLNFGVGGALVLGVYVIINAPLRNLIAYFEGLNAAGHWALTSDVFYGPLAIAGTVATLSANRQLHRWTQQANPNREGDASTAYFESLLLVSIPYSAVGYLVAPDISQLIFSAGISSEVSALAPQICIQNAAILVIYGLCYIAYTKERWSALYFSIASVAFLPFFAASATLADRVPWFDLVGAVTISTVACAVLITSSYILTGILKVRIKNIVRIILLSGFVFTIIYFSRLFYNNSAMSLFASIMGGFIYVLGAYLLGLFKIELAAPMES